jgi:glycosyltransferase involved in cell wall biosynthesis
MTGAPLVTVVMAAYRADDFLREALASALRQTLDDFEVIVADDAASPTTRALVDSFGDRRVRYTANPSPLGVAANHWAALQRARGHYVAVLNHDDRWCPEFLATVVAALEASPDAVLAFGDHNVIDARGNFLAEETEAMTRRYGRDRLAAGMHRPFDQLLVAQSIPMVMAAAFRRSALRPEQEDFFVRCGPAYDLGLAVLLCATGQGAYYQPARLTDYRVHGGSLTSRADVAWAAGAALCWDRLARQTACPAVRREARARASESHLAAALRGMRSGQRKDVRTHAGEALRRRVSPRSLAVAALALLPGPVTQRLLART